MTDQILNHYTFECPIKGEAVMLVDCMAKHSHVMKGEPQKVEDKKCAVASLCWMCPVRNAFRVGGPWSHYDKIPRWKELKETPAKLPKDLLNYALSHTLPNSSDYRRAGELNIGCFDDELAAVQQSGVSTPITSRTPVAKKPSSLADAIADQDGKDFEKTVNKMTAELKRGSKNAPEQPKTKSQGNMSEKTLKRSDAHSETSGDVPKKKLSLAERAKLMKQKS